MKNLKSGRQKFFQQIMIIAVSVIISLTIIIIANKVVINNGNNEPEQRHEILSSKNMTLDDVYKLSLKGGNLLFEDFQQFIGVNVSSSFGRYIMVYGIDGGYRLIVHSNPTGKPDRVILESIWESSGSGIDIRYNDLHGFLRVTPSQNSITEYEALILAQVFSEFKLEPVSWELLGDDPLSDCKEALFARNLLDSLSGLPEPSWLFLEKSTNGAYLAVSKKTGIIYSGTSDLSGRIYNWREL